NQLALGGWSLSAQNAYDSATGVLYLGDGTRRSGQALHPIPAPGGGFLIPARQGREIYQFDQNGRHVSTLDRYTGTALYTLAYDSQGRLIGITDDSGNQTTVERSGDQPSAIVGPYGNRTTLSVDAKGYLSQVQQADGANTQLTYTDSGLLATLTDPRGNLHKF